MVIHMKYIISLLLLIPVLAIAESEDAISDYDLDTLASSYSVEVDVLRDYVESYNFKCPEAITEYKLESLLVSFDDYTEVSIMVESHRQGWRDIYVEARAGITCFSDGLMSKAY